MHNELMTQRLKFYETSKGFNREEGEQIRNAKLASLIVQQDKTVNYLEPIKEVQYRSIQSRESKSSSVVRIPTKKMDVDGYLKEKNDRLI
jgi:hypothetical protein